MKATVEKKALLDGLSQLVAVTERRNTIPILANVLIDVRETGEIRLTGSDLDIELTLAIAGSVAEAGTTTTAVHLLHGIVRELDDGAQVQLSIEEGRLLVLGAGRSRHKLNTLPPTDFPKIGEEGWTAEFDVAASTFAAIAAKCGFAQSSEEHRYYLCGTFLHRRKDRLVAAATDGHRLANIEFDAEIPDDFPDVIVPKKTVALITKLTEGVDGEVTVRVLRDRRIEIDNGSWRLTSKLIDGQYPDYSRVIPSANDKMVRLDPSLLAKAVRRVAAVSSEKGRTVKVELERDKVTVSTSSPENGSASEEVSVDYAGDPLTIGFNARYLLDQLAIVDGDTISIALADAQAPTLFTGSSSDARWVLMPHRV